MLARLAPPTVIRLLPTYAVLLLLAVSGCAPVPEAATVRNTIERTSAAMVENTRALAAGRLQDKALRRNLEEELRLRTRYEAAQARAVELGVLQYSEVPIEPGDADALARLQAMLRSDDFHVWWRPPGAPDVAAQFQWASEDATHPHALGVWSYPEQHEELLRRLRAALAG